MTSEITTRPEAPELTAFEVIERVITTGDLSRMTPSDRVAFYWRTCESLGLNPLTQPFQYLSLNGKTILYAGKNATDQLRSIHSVSVTSMRRERDEESGLVTVYAHGRLPDGREDESSGVVNLRGLSGDALANALMKAETKAKRRMTLAIVGLSFLDETEIDGGERLDVDLSTGEILNRPQPASLVEQVRAKAAAYSDGEETEPAPTAALGPQESTFGEAGPEAVLTGEPMSMEESAAIAPDDIEPDPEIEALIEHVASRSGGLTVQELADLARVAGAGKMKFAVALEVVPADVGKRVESMSDQERYALAVQMGLVGA